MGVTTMTTPRVIEPWCPQVGDWVRVQPSPECRAWHSQSDEPYPAYGRVEDVVPDYDDPEVWIRELAADPDQPTPTDEARAIAQVHAGHRYYVTDAVGDPPRVVWIDGMYAAMELEPVPALTALIRIRQARRELDRLGPDFKLLRALFGAAGRSWP